MKKEDTHYRLYQWQELITCAILKVIAPFMANMWNGKLFCVQTTWTNWHPDLDYLTLLPLRTVVDFRGEAEKRAASIICHRLCPSISHCPSKPAIWVILHILTKQSECCYGRSVRIHRSPYAGYIQRVFRILTEKANTRSSSTVLPERPDRRHCSCIAAFGSGSGTRYNNKEDYMLSAQHIQAKYDFITKTIRNWSRWLPWEKSIWNGFPCDRQRIRRNRKLSDKTTLKQI